MKLLRRWAKPWRKKTMLIQHEGRKKCKKINFIPLIIGITGGDIPRLVAVVKGNLKLIHLFAGKK